MVLPSKGEVIELYDAAINGWSIGKVVNGKRYWRGARNWSNPYFMVNLYREQFGSTNVYGGSRIRKYNPLVPNHNNNLQIGDKPWMSRAYDPCTERHSKVYFNHPEVQKALHANVTGVSYAWDTCSDIVGNYWDDSPRSMLPIYQELIAAGIRIWVFSGDTDSVVPVTATRYSIDALKLPTLVNWYPWYDDGKLGGWSQVYKGLTFVSVIGAGHEVPLHRPRQAFIMFRSFLENKPMQQSAS